MYRLKVIYMSSWTLFIIFSGVLCIVSNIIPLAIINFTLGGIYIMIVIMEYKRLLSLRRAAKVLVGLAKRWESLDSIYKKLAEIDPGVLESHLRSQNLLNTAIEIAQKDLHENKRLSIYYGLGIDKLSTFKMYVFEGLE